MSTTPINNLREGYYKWRHDNPLHTKKEEADWFINRFQQELSSLEGEIEGMENPIRHFSVEDDNRDIEVSPVGGHKCNFNCKPDVDEVGYNKALSHVLAIIRQHKEG